MNIRQLKETTTINKENNKNFDCLFYILDEFLNHVSNIHGQYGWADKSFKNFIEQMKTLTKHQRAYVLDLGWCKACQDYRHKDKCFMCKNEVIDLTENINDLFPYIIGTNDGKGI